MADGVDKISVLSGLPREDLLSIWDRVKANHAKLDACPRHDFVDTAPDKPYAGKWRCRECGGEADRHAVFWYQRGREHGTR